MGNYSQPRQLEGDVILHGVEREGQKVSVICGLDVVVFPGLRTIAQWSDWH